MSAVDDPETVVLVHGWMHVLCGDTAAAEDWAVEALLRHRRQQVPRWLRQQDAMVQLKYVVVRVVLERRDLL